MSKVTKSIPRPMGDLFVLLRGDLVEACARWKIYKDLHVRNPRRVALLQETAAWLFHKLRLLLVDDVILSIARFGDRRGFRNQDRQSLERLLETPDERHHSNLLADVRPRLEELKSQCKPFIVHRNNRVAHRDLAARQYPDINPLPGLPVDSVDSALGGIADVMNVIEVYFTGGTMGYLEVIVPYHEDVDGLVWALKKAHEVDPLVDQLRLSAPVISVFRTPE